MESGTRALIILRRAAVIETVRMWPPGWILSDTCVDTQREEIHLWLPFLLFLANTSRCCQICTGWGWEQLVPHKPPVDTCVLTEQGPELEGQTLGSGQSPLTSGVVQHGDDLSPSCPWDKGRVLGTQCTSCSREPRYKQQVLRVWESWWHRL